MSGISEKKILKNAERGIYYIPKQVMQTHPVPHRELDGQHRIIIENYKLYRADVSQYGAYQAQKWLEQGKYNLSAEELEIVHLQIERKYQPLPKRTASQFYATTSTEHFLRKWTTVPNFRI